MPDLTPLEAAENLENLIDYAGDTLDDALEFNLCKVIDCAAFYLRKITAGEYAPMVHAHWTNYYEPLCSNPHADCSICGHTQTFGEHGGKVFAPKYCENCAAMMDGKDDSHETD